MADDAKGNEDAIEIAGRHLFSAGGDVNDAQAKLMGLLSDDDPEKIVETVVDEKGEPADDPAPVVVEDEQKEEEAPGEEPAADESQLGSEAEEDVEYEYVDEAGNVIEEPEADETYTVMVDGKERQATLEELTQSFSFRAHNTQKSQDLAAERKTLDEEAETVRQGRDLYGQRLQQVEQALANQYPAEPDWDKLEVEHPEKVAVESAKWQKHLRKVDALKSEQQRVEDEQVADQQKRLDDYKADQARLLLVAIPEWNDVEVSKAEQARLFDYAQASLGLSEEEVGSLMDHRAIMAMRKAMKYDELQAKGSKAQQKGKKAQTLKPGTRRRRIKAGASKRRVASRQQLSKSGRMADASAALFNILDDDA